MKKRYDVGKWLGNSMRFVDQKEAFTLAKEIAKQDGESLMRELTWNETGAITIKTIAVKADGSYRRIN